MRARAKWPKGYWLSRFGAALALLTLAVVTSHAWAQEADDDDEDDDVPSAPAAMLSLRMNQRGDASVNFQSMGKIQVWAPVEAALEQALHCRAGALTHPESRPEAQKYLQSLSEEQRERYDEIAEEARNNSLRGECSGAMTYRGLMLSTEMDFGSLLKLLKQNGLSNLWVTLTYPQADYSEHTPTSGRQPVVAGYSYLHYQFDSELKTPAVIHLAFGMRREDAIKSAAYPVAFLLLPIVILLWMQRAAIRDAERDPTGAWFSYLRVLSWCGNGVLIGWMIGFSIRHGLETIFAYQLAANNAGAVALSIALLMLPPWLVYLVCLLMSYPVYVRVRGEAWTRGEFLANQLLSVGTVLLPLMCFVGATGMLVLNARVATALFLGVFLTYRICAQLRLRISETHPEALTAGELRDRVFELAKKAAVEVRQVYLMAAGKSMMANAFASGSKCVIFTDYLLKRLDKREVAAVAAHELTHIQKRHVMWKRFGLAGLIASPLLGRWFLNLLAGSFHPGMHAQAAGANFANSRAVLSKALTFPELDLIFYVIGFGLYLLQSRSMERSADTGAVQLTQDPEAVITGLLKLSRINLLPIQWGPVTGSLFTHPSMQHRVERVARIGQVPPARLEEILGQYRAMEMQGASVAQPEEFFHEAQPERTQVLTTARATQSAINKSRLLQLLHILPPMLVVWAVSYWKVREASLAYIAGALGCIAVYSLAAHWMSVWGRSRLQGEFKAKLEGEGISVPERDTELVALSPGPGPRFFVAGFYWDIGYLFFSRDGLFYAGDLTRFAMRPEQVKDVRLGTGLPGWFPTPLVYLECSDEDTGAVRTWNLSPRMPGPFWRERRQALALFAKVQRWRLCPEEYAEASAGWKELPAPTTGEVTSLSPRSLFTFGRSLRLACWLVFLGLAICYLLGFSASWFVCCVVVLLRVFESLPFWLYKEPRSSEPPAVVAAAIEAD